MGNVSYSAHISNGKSAITSKSKLLGVAKHNLRKYKSPEYSSDNILLLRGTEDLYQDVKNVYHQEFDEVVQQYNQKHKRADRRIEDYFEHVANLEQDMAVEIIFQCGDKKFWEEHMDKKEKMYNVYAYLLSTMERLLPNFKVANAVIHFDEASPHMHVVGVPVWEGAKKGLSKKVSKRNVFTPESLSVILQDKLREEAGSCFRFNVKEELAEKKQGRNHDLSVMEYKVAKETERLEELQREVVDTDNELFASKLAYRQVQRENEDELREIKQEISEKQSENLKLDYVISYKRDKLKEYDDEISKWEQFKNTLIMLKEYISAYLPLSPLIEEFANCVEHKKDIEAGNSFRGLLNALGQFLRAFKELIVDGVCWFPRLMRWETSKGEVGVKGESRFSFPKATHNESGVGLKKYVSVEEALDDLPKVIYDENGSADYLEMPKTEYQKRMRNVEKVTEHFMPQMSELDKYIVEHVKPGGNYMDIPPDVKSSRIRRLQREGGHTTCYGRMKPDEPSYTINTYFNRPNVGCNIHYREDRLITVREALRLQSFPDSYVVVSSSKQGRNLIVGNAVPPMLAEVMAKELKKYVEEEI